MHRRGSKLTCVLIFLTIKINNHETTVLTRTNCKVYCNCWYAYCIAGSIELPVKLALFITLRRFITKKPAACNGKVTRAFLNLKTNEKTDHPIRQRPFFLGCN